MSTSLKVVQMRESTLRDVPAQLRQLADEIERGDHGEVTCAGAVIMGRSFQCFGWGDGIHGDTVGPSVAMLFQAGALRILKAIEAHGRD